MSAIAARKARLAEQGLLPASTNGSPSSIDGQSSPATTQPTPKRKGKILTTTGASREPSADTKRTRKRSKYGAAAPTSVGHSSDNIQYHSSEFEAGASDVSDPESDERDDQVRSEPAEFAFACSTLKVELSGPLKNWHRIECDGNGPDRVIIGLSDGDTLQFVGKVSIRALDGQCTIAGALLTPQHRNVIVLPPTTGPLPALIGDSVGPSCRAFAEYGLVRDDFAAVVSVETVADTQLEHLSKVCPLVRPTAFRLPDDLATVEGQPTPTFKGFQPVLSTTTTLTSMSTPKSWEHTLNDMQRITSTFTCMIRGPKRVGKSTFSRMLLNRLLSKDVHQVAYLETDLGQAEFNPPGLVALHLFNSSQGSATASSDLVIGPSWTSLRTPLRSHFLGDVSPKDDPTTYLAAIQELFQYYRHHLQARHVSLIVNTQGWVKGLGARLSAQIEELISPNHLFDMMIDVEGSNGTSGSVEKPRSMISLEAIPPSMTRDRGLNAVESRTLNLTSYFYTIASPRCTLEDRTEELSLSRWDVSTPLVHRRPIVVDVREGVQGGLHVLPGGSSVDPALKLMALNGSCVAIVAALGSGVGAKGRGSDTRTEWARLLSLPQPKPQDSQCLGLAIVRSIDVDNGCLHLLTSIDSSVLKSLQIENMQLALVKGGLEVPVWLSLDFDLIAASQGSASSSSKSAYTPQVRLADMPFSQVPFLDFESDTTGKEQIVGSTKRKTRRNILRKSQKDSR